ncbi:MAG: hypothetical protein RBR62_04955 [Bacteroidales bacterium]|jgi:hypothetical protein|nr:hypothetical protein [Bacteroidales bacterium]
MKVTNIHLHLVIGLASGMFAGIASLSIQENQFNIQPYLYLLSIAFFLLTLAWEIRQWKKSRIRLSYYLAVKWLDTLLDLVFGNLGFNLALYVICWWLIG